MIDFALFVLLAAAPLIVSSALKRWKVIIFVVMSLLVFEGAIRKWLLPEYQTQVYLAKDILLIVALAGFLFARKLPGVHQPLMSPLNIMLLLVAGFAFMQLANPNSPSFLVSLIGVKNYILYAVLAYLVPYVFESATDLEVKCKRYMLLMIPVALLGLVQFASPADSPINVYVKQHDVSDIAIARFGEESRARASGTFSYIGGYATFVVAMFNFALAFVLAGGKNIRQNIVPYALLLTSFAAMFTTGSRSVVWGQLVLFVIILLLCKRAGLLTGALAKRLTASIAVMALVMSFVAGDVVDAFSQRASTADDPVVRLLSPITEFLQAFEGAPVFGMGIGATHGSAAAIMGTQDYWWLDGRVFELETARVMTEVGIFGFALVFGLRVYLVMFAISMVTRLRTPLFRALSAVIASFFMLHLGLSVINNPTAGLYYWFAVGLLFAMYRLERAPARARPRLPVAVQSLNHPRQVPEREFN